MSPQNLRYSSVPIRYGGMQGAGAGFGHGIRFSAAVKQELDDIRPAHGSGVVKSRRSGFGFRRVHFGAVIEQKANCGSVAAERCIVKRGAAILIGGVNIRPVFQKKRGYFALPFRAASPSGVAPLFPRAFTFTCN